MIFSLSSAKPWRFMTAPAASIATGGIAGAIEGWLAATEIGGNALNAGLLGAGLLAPLGLFVGLITIGVLVLTFGQYPLVFLSDFRRRLRSDIQAAKNFIAGSLVFWVVFFVFVIAAFYLARATMSTFEHVGLGALFLVAVFGVLGLSLWIAAVRATRLVSSWLGFLPERILENAAFPSILLVPCTLIVAVWLSPVDGSGLIGFLGLLKRDELELAFIGWAVIPAVGAMAVFFAMHPRQVRWIAVASFLGCGLGVGATAFAAVSFNSVPQAAAALEQSTGMSKRLLAIFRRISDRDGDGVSSLFGGGDCDDRDPARQPGAIDVPNNGLDEDCSGMDAVLIGKTDTSLSKEAAHTKPVKPADNLSLVILSVDALRWDVGYMGYERPITPNIDRLAERGIIFERAYALSSFTGRSLAPMFIGRYPSETFCNYAHLNKYLDKNQMLAETLLEAGLNTAAVGSHYYFKGHGLDQGFERYYVEVPPGPKNIDQKVTSDLVANRAVEILSDSSFTSKRFFLWAHFMDPHRDYLPHPGFPNFGSKARDRYDGEVAFTDHHLGRVVDVLEDKGLLERTVIMITADHGEAFMEHDIRFHGRRLWEEVVRVPWVWVVPGTKPKRVSARVSHIDLVATVHDLLGIKSPTQAGGHALSPLMIGKTSNDRRIFIEEPPGDYVDEMYALIDDDYKLIHRIIGNRFQLFNLETDPGEKYDLAQKETKKLETIKNIYRIIRTGLERNAPRKKNSKKK
ncbi:MAG: sulfatase-like hydrolase/transferase [Proteobacteria bacterium]|nr:sulfatase-like hydrolase/transferase [Pseudomonadota bacterium]